MSFWPLCPTRGTRKAQLRSVSMTTTGRPVVNSQSRFFTAWLTMVFPTQLLIHGKAESLPFQLKHC